MTVGDEIEFTDPSVWLAGVVGLDPRQAAERLHTQLPHRFIVPDTKKAGKARQTGGCEAIVLERDRGSRVRRRGSIFIGEPRTDPELPAIFQFHQQ